ncbi:MAG: hypothetical protein U1E89_00830 [Burkholderiaceae bacterium]
MSAPAARLAAQEPIPAAAPIVAAADSTHDALEGVLQRVEHRLSELQQALAARDMPCLELHAGELQRALAAAVERFVRVARQGGVPPSLRQRLAHAGARIAAQRDALARATAAMDRALDVLMPGAQRGAPLYSAQGTAEHRSSGTALQA